MDNIIFNTELIKGAKGDTGDTGLSYEVPTGAVIAYDGAGIPEGYVETTEPLPPTPSGGLEFTLNEILAQVVTSSSRQTITQTLTEGKYIVLYSCSMNDAPPNNNITYSGSGYSIIHSYRDISSYPNVGVDIVDITDDTTVTIDYQTRSHGGHAIYKLNDVNTVGNVTLEAVYNPTSNEPSVTVDMSQLTITTDYVLITVFASDQSANNGYSYAGFNGGEIDMSFYPMFAQMGKRYFTTGFAMIAKASDITELVSFINNTGKICAFVCEIS